VATAAGRDAAIRHHLPPFIDGSIRREPDLEHATPSISCLCRGANFAPRLRVGDVVAYMTVKGTYGEGSRHHRLTALLRVARLFDSHADAAVWFKSVRRPLPSNCMVDGNEPNPVDRSHRSNNQRHPEEAEWTRRWDLGYRQRARASGRFVVCDALWRDLDWSAPRLTERDLASVFGRVPGTRNPGAWPTRYLVPLAERAEIRLG
jgi:hypothetical protein